jgi:hypothetical protein
MSIRMKIDMSGIKNRLRNIPDDDVLMTEIYNIYAKMMNPYVPMDEGVLSQSARVSSDGVTYPGPYAHYQYIGLVYGPNIPIIENGEIVGWFSPPRQTKHPTGEELKYSTEKHPLASKEWNKAMMRDKGDAFTKEVEKAIARRLNDGS